MKSFSEFVLNVVRWSEERKIIPRSTPLAQSRKTGEEAIELIEAAAKMKLLKDLEREIPILADHLFFIEQKEVALAEFRDAAGDVTVTLVNACALADVDLVDCCWGAWDQIKDRKGTLLPNGIFQKA